MSLDINELSNKLNISDKLSIIETHIKSTVKPTVKSPDESTDKPTVKSPGESTDKPTVESMIEDIITNYIEMIKMNSLIISRKQSDIEVWKAYLISKLNTYYYNKLSIGSESQQKNIDIVVEQSISYTQKKISQEQYDIIFSETKKINIKFFKGTTQKAIEDARSCCILSFGNSDVIGGGYAIGHIGSQEESLCRNILGLYDSLKKSNPNSKLLNESDIGIYKDNRYTYDKSYWWDKSIWISTNLYFYINETNSNKIISYNIMEKSIPVSVITAAAPDFRYTDRQGNIMVSNVDRIIDYYIDIIQHINIVDDNELINKLLNTDIMKCVKKIIYTICTTKIENDTLILGGFGIGAFIPNFKKMNGVRYINNDKKDDQPSRKYRIFDKRETIPNGLRTTEINGITEEINNKSKEIYKRTIARIMFQIILNCDIKYKTIYFAIMSELDLNLFKDEFEKLLSPDKKFEEELKLYSPERANNFREEYDKLIKQGRTISYENVWVPYKCSDLNISDIPQIQEFMLQYCRIKREYSFTFNDLLKLYKYNEENSIDYLIKILKILSPPHKRELLLLFKNNNDYLKKIISLLKRNDNYLLDLKYIYDYYSQDINIILKLLELEMPNENDNINIINIIKSIISIINKPHELYNSIKKDIHNCILSTRQIEDFLNNFESIILPNIAEVEDINIEKLKYIYNYYSHDINIILKLLNIPNKNDTIDLIVSILDRIKSDKFETYISEIIKKYIIMYNNFDPKDLVSLNSFIDIIPHIEEFLNILSEENILIDMFDFILRIPTYVKFIKIGLIKKFIHILDRYIIEKKIYNIDLLIKNIEHIQKFIKQNKTKLKYLKYKNKYLSIKI